jgi:hypothetical protein
MSSEIDVVPHRAGASLIAELWQRRFPRSAASFRAEIDSVESGAAMSVVMTVINTITP